MLKFFEYVANAWGIPVWAAAMAIIIISTWSLIWKGLALWKSARKNHLVWFIVILVVNTVGILEILYLYVFSQMKKEKKVKKKRSR